MSYLRSSFASAGEASRLHLNAAAALGTPALAALLLPQIFPIQALYPKGGAKHTFKNTGTVAATIVEVFGRGPAAAARHEEIALAQALAAVTGRDVPAPRR